MAIKVSGTEVITNNSVLQNVTGLKTVGGQSILGSGDISAGGAPWNSSNGTAATVNSGNTFVAGSSNADRYFIGYFQNGGYNSNHFGFKVNGNNDFVQVTGYQPTGLTANNSNTGPQFVNTMVITANTTNNFNSPNQTGAIYISTNQSGEWQHFGRIYVRGFIAANNNITLFKLNNNENSSSQNAVSVYSYWDD